MKCLNSIVTSLNHSLCGYKHWNNPIKSKVYLPDALIFPSINHATLPSLNWQSEVCVNSWNHCSLDLANVPQNTSGSRTENSYSSLWLLNLWPICVKVSSSGISDENTCLAWQMVDVETAFARTFWWSFEDIRAELMVLTACENGPLDDFSTPHTSAMFVYDFVHWRSKVIKAPLHWFVLVVRGALLNLHQTPKNNERVSVGNCESYSPKNVRTKSNSYFYYEAWYKKAGNLYNWMHLAHRP